MNKVFIGSILIATCVAEAQVTKPSAQQRTGPAAASLATPYRGPLKFDPRVLATERDATLDPNPITRAASWRYRYSSRFPCYGGYYGYGYRGYGGYGGYRGYRSRCGFFPLTGGATSLGFWGPSY